MRFALSFHFKLWLVVSFGIGIALITFVLVLSRLFQPISRLDVVQALQQQQIPVVFTGPSQGFPFVSQSSEVYQIGSSASGRFGQGEGQLFISSYPNSLSAWWTAQQVPSTADSGLTDWIGKPHFYRCANVMTVYLDFEPFHQAHDQQVQQTLATLCGASFAGQP